MRILQLIAVYLITATLMTSCVTSKKYNAAEADLTKTKNDLNDCQTNLAKGQIANKKLNEQVNDLKAQVDDSKQRIDSFTLHAADNNQLINTLKDMNIVSADQAQSIQQSLQAINGSGKDALNTALITNLKSALGNESDTDIFIQSDKGNLYIDLTDHMFFNSGSADLTPHARAIVEKVAKILNAYPDMHFMIEGHTDNKPIHTACVPDNWDLSIRRATAVVRMLQKEYKVDPTRMIAAGHSEYEPVEPNDTKAHMAENRRITIVMTPQLDQFFKLLVKK